MTDDKDSIEERRAAFAQSFSDRRKIHPEDQPIVSVVQQYYFEIYNSAMTHGEGESVELGGEIVAWLQGISKAAKALFDLLDPIKQPLLKSDTLSQDARNMLFMTFAAGVMTSPLHEYHLATMAPQEREEWLDMFAQAPLPFRFGAGIGHPFLQILADLAEHPARPGLSWNFFNSKSGSEKLRAPAEGDLNLFRDALGAERTDDLSSKEALQRSRQLLCARLYGLFSRRGKKTGTYEDLSNLMAYHDVPLSGFPRSPRPGEKLTKNQLDRLKMQVSRGRVLLEEQKGKKTDGGALGWDAFFTRLVSAKSKEDQ